MRTKLESTVKRIANSSPALPGWNPGRKMRFAGIQVAGILAVLLLATLAGRAEESAALLDRWCAAQTNLLTWSADVQQTRALQMLSQPLVVTGRVWVALPNRFRWELGQPPQTIALRQPDQLLLIYPRLKRAEKYPIANAPAGPWKDALSLLDASFPRSRAELESHFRVQSVSQSNGVVQLALQPRSATARKFITGIQVSFRTNDLSLTATELQFSDGSSLRNDFSHAVLNAPLAADCFEAKLGPDFTVVEPLRP
jgi:outer membrane lipoprotein-sorting protein